MAEVPVPQTQGEIEAQRMELDLDAFDDKVEILPGYEADLSAATYCLHNEDHTLGNALRWMLMKNPDVEFCGYSNPHPSEPKIHVRVQMYDQKSSLDALRAALENLESLFTSIGDAYQTSLDKGEYEQVKEPGLTEEELEAVVKRGDEIRTQLRQEGKGLADR